MLPSPLGLPKPVRGSASYGRECQDAAALPGGGSRFLLHTRPSHPRKTSPPDRGRAGMVAACGAAWVVRSPTNSRASLEHSGCSHTEAWKKRTTRCVRNLFSWALTRSCREGVRTGQGVGSWAECRAIQLGGWKVGGLPRVIAVWRVCSLTVFRWPFGDPPSFRSPPAQVHSATWNWFNRCLTSTAYICILSELALEARHFLTLVQGVGQSLNVETEKTATQKIGLALAPSRAPENLSNPCKVTLATLDN